ncbi:hypothetical protein [Bradyrhizobium sp. NAS96.2]|uniref:hypothetical protein n=1 Tax=Bradyrhizobium sp. NAS96.2 TaxID=1680160 RepID=UPI0009400A94|nr:hypothetical protein [Bradyrhizobium sp. NAS96.2]OKO67489.1 hypothetical protein AC628_38970 [Bradyrhizobium sp. NAS96.2]
MGYLLLSLIPLVILIAWLAGAARWAARGYVLSAALMGLGALGFIVPLFLPATGTWLQQIELPPFFETTTILGPAGRTFTATIPTERIQRYDSNGRFETGWFVHSAGGMFAIGLTVDGRIAVAAARTKQVEFFNPDGSSAGQPQPCPSFGSVPSGVLRPSNCPVWGVTFVDPIQTARPGAHWQTLLLLPFWHPFVAWLLAVSGVLGIRINRASRVRLRSDSPRSSDESDLKSA